MGKSLYQIVGKAKRAPLHHVQGKIARSILLFLPEQRAHPLLCPFKPDARGRGVRQKSFAQNVRHDGTVRIKTADPKAARPCHSARGFAVVVQKQRVYGMRTQIGKRLLDPSAVACVKGGAPARKDLAIIL